MYNILYPWLEKTHKKILNHYKKNTIINYYPILIHSKHNIGEDILCRSISFWLICNNHNNIKHCDKCNSCKLMKFGNYPDYYEIILEKNKNDNLEYLYSCINNLYQLPCYGKCKVISILNSELLSQKIINIIVKVIDKPPKNTYFIFTSSKEDLKLLINIKNYCFYFPLYTPIRSIGLNWLQKNIKDINITICDFITSLQIYNGSPIQAKYFLSSTLKEKRNIFCNKIIQSISEKNFLILLPMFLEENIQNDLIIWIMSLLYDAIKNNFTDLYLINIDKLELIQLFTNKFSTTKLFIQWKHWLNCKKILNNIENINYELLFSYFLLSVNKLLI
ncbi:MAG: DNA polymerase III subunit delta' [Candidatus Westeberhardia cardiocondylae]|nr:DNA polymerase III subunit delta' [Candidatus Westeberhardia cardiocondylae]